MVSSFEKAGLPGVPMFEHDVLATGLKVEERDGKFVPIGIHYKENFYRFNNGESFVGQRFEGVVGRIPLIVQEDGSKILFYDWVNRQKQQNPDDFIEEQE